MEETLFELSQSLQKQADAVRRLAETRASDNTPPRKAGQLCVVNTMHAAHEMMNFILALIEKAKAISRTLRTTSAGRKKQRFVEEDEIIAVRNFTFTILNKIMSYN